MLVPLYLVNKFEMDKACEVAHFEKEFEIQDVKIIIEKIKIQTMMVCDGFKMRLAGKSDDYMVFNNANQLIIDGQYIKVIKEVMKFVADKQMKKDINVNINSLLCKQNLQGLYEMYCEKISNTIYSTMYSNFIKVLESGKEKFSELSIEEQAMQLYEIHKLFQCTPEMPDLSKIGGTKKYGRIRVNINVSKKENLAIIHQSITGLYEQIVRVNS